METLGNKNEKYENKASCIFFILVQLISQKIQYTRKKFLINYNHDRNRKN